MKREDLKAKGFTDEQIDYVMAEYGKAVEGHKTKLSTVETELDGLKAQLTEAGKTIEGFKGMDIEGIKKASEEYKVQAEQARKDADARVSALQFDHALERELKAAKVKDIVSVKAHLKTDALKHNAADDTIIGLKEQLDPLRTSKDFLFEAEGETPTIVAGGQSRSVLSDKTVDAMRASAGLPTK
jgi:hypothetical protein